MSVNEPWGETPVPELYGRGRATWPSLYRVADGEEVLAGITAHLGAADLAPRTWRRGLGAADWAPRTGRRGLGAEAYARPPDLWSQSMFSPAASGT